MFSQEIHCVSAHPEGLLQRRAASCVASKMNDLCRWAEVGGDIFHAGTVEKIHLFVIHEEPLIEKSHGAEDLVLYKKGTAQQEFNQPGFVPTAQVFSCVLTFEVSEYVAPGH